MEKQIAVTEKKAEESQADDLVVSRSASHLLYQRTIGSLCATDYKWVQQEQVVQGKLIIEVYEE